MEERSEERPYDSPFIIGIFHLDSETESEIIEKFQTPQPPQVARQDVMALLALDFAANLTQIFIGNAEPEERSDALEDTERIQKVIDQAKKGEWFEVAEYLQQVGRHFMEDAGPADELGWVQGKDFERKAQAYFYMAASLGNT